MIIHNTQNLIEGHVFHINCNQKPSVKRKESMHGVMVLLSLNSD